LIRDLRRSLLCVIVPVLALGACSSSTNSPAVGSQGGDEPDAAVDTASDGAASPSDGASSARDGAAGAVDAAANGGAAGKAGADSFCSALCNHEQRCAATLDAAPAGLADCMTNCESANEASTANPATELLRADYLSDLGGCIASSSCSDALQTSESTCAASVVSGGGGARALVPTQAVASFCHELETSPCVAADSGARDCVTEFMPYSDGALNAAIACFSESSCSAIASCYGAAFTQM
jgi:hypothetical protein